MHLFIYMTAVAVVLLEGGSIFVSKLLEGVLQYFLELLQFPFLHFHLPLNLRFKLSILVVFTIMLCKFPVTPCLRDEEG